MRGWPSDWEQQERENNLSREQRAALKKIYQFAHALTQGADKVANDLEDVLDKKTFSVLSDYAVAMEAAEGSLRAACLELKIKGVT